MASNTNSFDCTKALKAVADESRLKIIRILFHGEYSVSHISANTGINYSKVSHHLGVPKNAGLVQDHKDGKFVIYEINPSIYKHGNKSSNELNLN